MKLSGLHILLTYQCNYECDHCFVWGSSRQTGVFTWAQLEEVYNQALELRSVEECYFEGGEAFLYHPLLVRAVGRAHELSFRTGIVSNGYWATTYADAALWLEPLAAAGLDELDVSCDIFHGSEIQEQWAKNATAAAKALGIRTAEFHLNPPVVARSTAEGGQGAPVTGGDIMFRGRAAVALTKGLSGQPWDSFDACPYENLTAPSRLHVDPFGNLHLCQGLVIGNLFQQPLKEILIGYQPDRLAIVNDLLAGGPAQIVRTHNLDHASHYVDACHLCYEARQALRPRFPTILTPDQMYGVV